MHDLPLPLFLLTCPPPTSFTPHFLLESRAAIALRHLLRVYPAVHARNVCERPSFLPSFRSCGTANPHNFSSPPHRSFMRKPISAKAIPKPIIPRVQLGSRPYKATTFVQFAQRALLLSGQFLQLCPNERSDRSRRGGGGEKRGGRQEDERVEITASQREARPLGGSGRPEIPVALKRRLAPNGSIPPPPPVAHPTSVRLGPISRCQKNSSKKTKRVPLRKKSARTGRERRMLPLLSLRCSGAWHCLHLALQYDTQECFFCILRFFHKKVT